ncbi:hypothetical protein LTS17_008518 [Exophiala oligosperma]
MVKKPTSLNVETFHSLDEDECQAYLAVVDQLFTTKRLHQTSYEDDSFEFPGDMGVPTPADQRSSTVRLICVKRGQVRRRKENNGDDAKRTTETMQREQRRRCKENNGDSTSMVSLTAETRIIPRIDSYSTLMDKGGTPSPGLHLENGLQNLSGISQKLLCSVELAAGKNAPSSLPVPLVRGLQSTP